MDSKCPLEKGLGSAQFTAGAKTADQHVMVNIGRHTHKIDSKIRFAILVVCDTTYTQVLVVEVLLNAVL